MTQIETLRYRRAFSTKLGGSSPCRSHTGPKSVRTRRPLPARAVAVAAVHIGRPGVGLNSDQRLWRFALAPAANNSAVARKPCGTNSSMPNDDLAVFRLLNRVKDAALSNGCRQR